MRRFNAIFLAIVSLSLSACELASAPATDVRDVRGTWRLTGTQVAPARSVEGTLWIESQARGEISGSAIWQETDGGGGAETFAGPISGRVIGQDDIDFEVQVGGSSRRHVGQIAADTVVGAWLDVSTGASGDFRAVRTAAP